MDTTQEQKRSGGDAAHRETILGDFEVPKVDMARAASFRPSRVSGKHVSWLVLFVSGMGVSRVHYVSLLR